MKAVIINEYGGKDQLKEVEIEKPKPKKNQVVVKAEATSINPIDWKLREGYLKEMLDWEFPIILGWDVAGVIEEVGDGVSNWQVGDRVFARPATTRFGTYAEYTAVDANLLSFIPDNLTAKEAAAVPLAGLTAWQSLFTNAKLKKGEKVLIHGGAGGVGTFAIQLAKHVGAYVYTTASAHNHELVKSLGVDEVIDYKNEDFTQVLSEVDVVFDTIGGEVQSSSYQVLKKGAGRLVTIVGQPDEEEATRYGVKAYGVWLEPDGSQLKELASLIEESQVRVVIDKTFSFGEKGLRDAHAESETGHASGKIVIEF
ncbi:NADP-dependent oxidoreductase [Shouchella patagoniensis]|uniref:NADP-dependent oxidoreductase n=1 Tax=Shouchella patagoniensis TaxID=228576 RepID=UPI00099557EA|nr:NADP-dependent oxidoreductase [Shouchella patagoniensis]